MLQFAFRRLLSVVPTLLIVMTIVFGMVRLLPGDPARVLLGQNATPQAIAELHHSLGLDRPILEQYFSWLGQLARFDFGHSLKDNTAIGSLIAATLPTTMELAALSLVIAVLIALPTGILSALHPGSWIDRGATLLALSGLSLPNFFLGIMLIYLFSIKLAWIPASGYVSFAQDPMKNLLLLLLPALTLGMQSAAILMRYLRSTTMETLSQDYVRTARAKGLQSNVIVFKHVLRNSLIPVLTSLGLQLGGLLGGAVITEQIFSVPGFGRLLIDAVFSRDLPVIQAVVLLSSVAVFTASFLVDVAYGAVDPRIRHG